MLIKKHRNRNEYYLTPERLWVRNFTKTGVVPIDTNNLIPKSDYQLFLDNEVSNHSRMLQRIDTESFKHQNIAIIGDDYGFESQQKILETLPSDVVVIGVNKTVVLWNNNKKMNYYVVNDPYESCLGFLPREQQRVWPRCIASVRANPDFLSRFNGMVYSYTPVKDEYYSGMKSDSEYFIDDYRNSVCAAIGLAYKFGVKRLMLFWCGDSFEEHKSSAKELPNGRWIYPQQLQAHSLADGNLYWLKNNGIKTGYWSNGPEYKNAEYITEQEIIGFFTK